jgi:cell division protein FtsI (penicillin-binding protein 3)
MNEIRYPRQNRVSKRTAILAFFFFLWFFGLTLRLVELQVIEHSRLKAAVLRQNQVKPEIIPGRGTIRDRRGKIMARSLPFISVCFLPLDDESADKQFARILPLRKILDLSEKELQNIKAKIEGGGPFIWVRRKISPEKAELVRRLNINGIGFQQEHKRYYPLGTLAAHVLGGVNIDDVGANGVEFQYNSRLEGVKGKSLILKDGHQRRYHLEVLKQPTPGEDLILTIDEPIQYIVERELAKAVREKGAQWGAAIVSQPSSGEILAMASYPTYDPNIFPPSPPEAERNKAIQHNFEPGSTFKIITAAAARESGLVNFNDIFDCSAGKIRVAGWTIYDHKKMGSLTFSEVIIHSSNVGTIQVGFRIGPENLYRMIKKFRFGEKTGIDLPGEEKGILNSLKSWTKTSLPAHAIGYEISVTAIQVLQAMNVIANRGCLVRPRITRETLDLAGPMKITPGPCERIISEKAANDLIEHIFEKVVLDGTGQAAQLDGYTVAGKTGTAQILNPETHAYSASRHLASFVGFVPAEDPLISIIVVIDDPQTGLHYGGQVAAPVFHEIAKRVVLYLRQPPEINPAKKIVTAQLHRESEE